MSLDYIKLVCKLNVQVEPKETNRTLLTLNLYHIIWGTKYIKLMCKLNVQVKTKETEHC